MFYYASGSTQVFATRVFILLLFPCNLNDQLSQSFHRCYFMHMLVFDNYQRCPVPLRFMMIDLHMNNLAGGDYVVINMSWLVNFLLFCIHPHGEKLIYCDCTINSYLNLMVTPSEHE